MSDPQQVTADQRAIVDQDVDERDPADDSDELNDPTAMTETYPQAFDDKIAEAENAIESETGTDLTDDETTGANDVTGRA